MFKILVPSKDVAIIKTGGKNNIHVVSWNNKRCGWCFGGGGAYHDMEFRKKIGNIYENKELLKLPAFGI